MTWNRTRLGDKMIIRFVLYIVILSLALLLLEYYWHQNKLVINNPTKIISKSSVLKRGRQGFKMETLNIGDKRLVHLDLKGGPPKVSYLQELFPMLKEWGATGILVEWEDTFPYWGADLSIIGSSGPDSQGVYTLQQCDELLTLAAQNELEVVPLVQSFGHLEFVLKHDKYREMREVEAFPSSLCPSKPGSLPLIQAMLNQILETHPDITTLHIGADEVWHLGRCDVCKRRMSEMPYNSQVAKDRLFLDHVTAVLKWLKLVKPNLQLLMWDDMMRHMDPILLQEFELGKLVEPMVWHYRSSEHFHLPPDLWTKYSSVFNGVWIATAYKGASGSDALLPNTSMHLDCQERWFRELKEQQNLNIRGVALTGWSRYDHYAVMCELLPTALPSLALCLAQLRAGAFTPELHLEVSQNLGYADGQLIPVHPLPQHNTAQLRFPGWRILNGVQWLFSLRAKVEAVVNSEQARTWLHPHYIHRKFSNPARLIILRRKLKRVRTWLSPWLVRRRFTNPMQLVSLTRSLPLILDEFAALDRMLRPALVSVLSLTSVDEWIGTAVQPARDRVIQLLNEAENQIILGGRIRGYNKHETF